MNKYTGMTEKGEAQSLEGARIVGDKVILHATNENDCTVGFDKDPPTVRLMQMI